MSEDPASVPDPKARDNGPSNSAEADKMTGEPKRGWLGFYQRIEDTLGQGAVACLLIVVIFFIYASWQIATL